MCGIAGRVGPNVGKVSIIRSMVNSLRHRGPDEEGFFVDNEIELGMRRLAIIDINQGQQPVTDESGNIIVVFNGEIYNFLDLRRGLESRGHIFRSYSDTEVIAHLYEEKGKSFTNYLRGMFAIAIWNKSTRTLLLARDRVGKKPLLYRLEVDGGISFASEARALLRPMGVKADVDLNALNHVLAYGHADAPYSAYSDLKRLNPGSWLEWCNGQITEGIYWEPDFSEPEDCSEDEAIQKTLFAIEEAVKVRLVSERPIGAFLSGGIDSTIVTALMVRQHSERVSTFTIGFREKSFNEAEYARSISKFLGTQHHELILDPNPEVLVAAMGTYFDEPFADSSALPTLILSEFARKYVVVALTGDGGDEGFSGYDRYRAIPILQKINVALKLFSPIAAKIESVSNLFGSRKLERFSREVYASPSLAERYCSTRILVDRKNREVIWSKDAKESMGDLSEPENEYLDLWNSVASRTGNLVATMSEMDIRRYLPGDLLVKVDIASMAHSLETRSPFLDREVLEVASRIPAQLRIKNGKTKYLLRQIAKQLVPAELVDRPKLGFGIPRAAWLRGPLRDLTHDLLTDTTARNRGWFDQAEVQKILNSHARGLNRDNLIWPLLAIEIWAREWIDKQVTILPDIGK